MRGQMHGRRRLPGSSFVAGDRDEHSRAVCAPLRMYSHTEVPDNVQEICSTEAPFNPGTCTVFNERLANGPKRLLHNGD